MNQSYWKAWGGDQTLSPRRKSGSNITPQERSSVVGTRFIVSCLAIPSDNATVVASCAQSLGKEGAMYRLLLVSGLSLLERTSSMRWPALWEGDVSPTATLRTVRGGVGNSGDRR